jgi:hypothetical protein
MKDAIPGLNCPLLPVEAADALHNPEKIAIHA